MEHNNEFVPRSLKLDCDLRAPLVKPRIENLDGNTLRLSAVDSPYVMVFCPFPGLTCTKSREQVRFVMAINGQPTGYNQPGSEPSHLPGVAQKEDLQALIGQEVRFAFQTLVEEGEYWFPVGDQSPILTVRVEE